MRRPGAIIIALAIVLSLGGVLYSLMRRGSAPEPPESAGNLLQQATSEGGAEISGARVVQRDAAGAVVWELEADGALEYDRQAKRIEGFGVRWRFMRKGQPAIEITAPSFVGDDGTQTLQFDKGVVITTPDGSQRFDASRVTYTFDSEILIAEQIRAHRGQYAVSAQRGEVDMARSTLRMSGGVRMARS